MGSNIFSFALQERQNMFQLAQPHSPCSPEKKTLETSFLRLFAWKLQTKNDENLGAPGTTECTQFQGRIHHPANLSPNLKFKTYIVRGQRIVSSDHVKNSFRRKTRTSCKGRGLQCQDFKPCLLLMVPVSTFVQLSSFVCTDNFGDTKSCCFPHLSHTSFE